MNEGRTREVAALLKRLGVEASKCLLVLPGNDPLVLRAARNLPRLRTSSAGQLNTYEVLHAEHVLITREALEALKEGRASMKDPRSIVELAIITEKGTRLRKDGQRLSSSGSTRQPTRSKSPRRWRRSSPSSVTQVRTMNRQGKPKRLGRFVGNRSNWKKAVVTLKSGQAIEAFDQV